jgi:uncharacterized membrane protein
MAKISKSITIQAPVSQVFEYVNAPEHLPEIWPSMLEVSHVERKPDGGQSFDWVYKMAAIHFKGHSEAVEVEQNARAVFKSEKGIQNTFRWTYAGEDGVTKVTIDVEYTMPGKLLGKLAAPFLEKVNEREAETLLHNLKVRMETGETQAPSKDRPQPSPAHH